MSDEHTGELKQLPLSEVSSVPQRWLKMLDLVERGPDGEAQLRVSGKSLSEMVDALGVNALADASVGVGVDTADDGRLREPAWFRRPCWRSSSLATAEESCLVLVN